MSHPEAIEPTPQPEQKSRLLSGSSAIRVLSNIVSMFVSAVFIRGASFVLYLLVGRFLGVFEFGQVSLALTLFNTVVGIAVAWLGTYITREIAKDRSLTGQYLINGSIVALLTSGVSLLLLYLFMMAMAYNPDTISVVMWIAIGLLPHALAIIAESIFQGWERMHFIVMVQFVGSVFKIAAIYLVLSAGHGVMSVVVVLIAAQFVALLLEWVFIVWRIPVGPLVIQLSSLREILQSSTAFLGLNFVLAIRSSLSLVLITKLIDEAGTGLFSAAQQFTVPAFLVLQSVSLSIFPIMCRQFGVSPAGLARVSEKTFELQLIIAVPAAVGLTLLAEDLLLFVYGSAEYVLAADVLRIGAWSLVIQAFTHVYGKVLFATNREKLSFQLASGVTVIWFILLYIFIVRFGIVGAAVGGLLASLVNLLAHYIPVSRMIFRVPIFGTAWKPVAASLIMAVVVMLLRDYHVVLNIAVSGLVYGLAWVGIAIASAGSFTTFKNNYIKIWSS